MNLALVLREPRAKWIAGYVSRTIGMRTCTTKSRVRHVHEIAMIESQYKAVGDRGCTPKRHPTSAALPILAAAAEAHQDCGNSAAPYPVTVRQVAADNGRRANWSSTKMNYEEIF